MRNPMNGNPSYSPQHNEQNNSWLELGLRKLPSTEAFMYESVLLFDTIGNYRPPNIEAHVDFVQYYDPKTEAS
jgi:hypothetical protein